MAGNVDDGADGAFSGINVTPLVDVMLVLLVIFMVTAPMMQQGVAVDLPNATGAALPQEDTALVVSVTVDGNLYLNDTKMDLGALTERLLAIREEKPATVVYLRAVARNLFLMSLRRAKRQAIVQNLEVIEEVWQQYAADDGEAYREAMRDCVETLTGRAREAIDLFYRDQRSRVEIARELEMTEDGVKSLLRRTREILRKCVEGKVGVDA